MRKKKPNQRKCECGGPYHFPHRRGSPLCEHNPNQAANIYRAMGAPTEGEDDGNEDKTGTL